MAIVFQQVVVADKTYSFTNGTLDTLFEIHNDTPYNAGMSFGTDTGVANAQYYLSPQTVLHNVPAPGAGADKDAYTVKAQQRFVGTVYLYTQTPMGGTTNFSSAPAQTITVISYSPGNAPQGITSLNRMHNVGNGVATTVTSTQGTLTNDGSAANTNIIEATQATSTSSNVSIDNSGNAYIAEYVSSVYQKLFQVVSGATYGIILGALNRAVHILGNLTVDGTSTFTGAITATGGVTGTASSANALNTGLNLPNGTMGKLANNDIIDAGVNGTTYHKGPLDASANSSVLLQAQGIGKASLYSGGGVTLAADGNNGVYINSGKLGRTAAADLIDASGNAVYLKGLANAGFIYQSPSGTTRWTLTAISHGSVTTATAQTIVTHNLGFTPDIVLAICNTANSSSTVGTAAYSATTFVLTSGAAPTSIIYLWVAIKF